MDTIAVRARLHCAGDQTLHTLGHTLLPAHKGMTCSHAVLPTSGAPAEAAFHHVHHVRHVATRMAWTHGARAVSSSSSDAAAWEGHGMANELSAPIHTSVPSASVLVPSCRHRPNTLHSKSQPTCQCTPVQALPSFRLRETAVVLAWRWIHPHSSGPWRCPRPSVIPRWASVLGDWRWARLRAPVRHLQHPAPSWHGKCATFHLQLSEMSHQGSTPAQQTDCR